MTAPAWTAHAHHSRPVPGCHLCDAWPLAALTRRQAARGPAGRIAAALSSPRYKTGGADCHEARRRPALEDALWAAGEARRRRLAGLRPLPGLLAAVAEARARYASA